MGFFQNSILPFRGSKSNSVSLYDRQFIKYRQLKFQASDNMDFPIEHLKMAFGQLHIAAGVEIELCFTLRSMVFKYRQLKVGASDNRDICIEHLKWHLGNCILAFGGSKSRFVFSLYDQKFQAEILAIKVSDE